MMEKEKMNMNETENVVMTEKRRRGRPRLDRMNKLKEFVESLRTTFPETDLFSREQLQVVGDSNMIGMTMFTSDKAGLGLETRVGRGKYAIPSKWLNGSAPW
jgi:hypothetical protein